MSMQKKALDRVVPEDKLFARDTCILNMRMLSKILS